LISKKEFDDKSENKSISNKNTPKEFNKYDDELADDNNNNNNDKILELNSPLRYLNFTIKKNEDLRSKLSSDNCFYKVLTNKTTSQGENSNYSRMLEELDRKKEILLNKITTHNTSYNLSKTNLLHVVVSKRINVG